MKQRIWFARGFEFGCDIGKLLSPVSKRALLSTWSVRHSIPALNNRCRSWTCSFLSRSMTTITSGDGGLEIPVPNLKIALHLVAT